MSRLSQVSAGRERRDAAQGGRRFRPLVACLCLAAPLAGCGGGAQEAHALGPSRVVEHVGREIRWNASPAERHGLSERGFAGAGVEDATDDGSSRLNWQTPPGWTEKPPAPFRDVNFQAGEDPRAECYLATLGGDAGGLEPNLNRWRAQMSLPPLGAAEIARLPRIPWLGGQAVLADFEGRWTGMSGSEAQDDWRLVGLVLVQPAQSRFLKLVGPREAVEAEVGAFRALADSFHAGGDEAHAHGVASVSATAGPGREAPQVRDDEDEKVSAAVDTQRSASLSWSAPPGWRRGPEKAMREVTYFAGEGDAVECYVTLLPGDAGGALANINRWCGQMGSPPLGEDDLEQLERVPMAGTEGMLVRLQRGAAPGEADARECLEGVVCPLGDRTLFVKLTGPRDAVQSQHAALLDFCMSLKASP